MVLSRSNYRLNLFRIVLIFIFSHLYELYMYYKATRGRLVSWRQRASFGNGRRRILSPPFVSRLLSEKSVEWPIFEAIWPDTRLLMRKREQEAA